MPFTPTHTLAAVPIAWFWPGVGIFPALVIGSMVPDWPLYVPFGPRYDLTHSLPGIFLACLPIGFAMAAFYQLLLQDALFELLPAALRQRVVTHLSAAVPLRPGLWLAIAAAVCVGAVTHVGWDAFTHRGAWGVNLIPWLNERIALTASISMPAYALMQHGSTVIGFPVFLLLFAWWFRQSGQHALRPARLTRATRNFWIVALTVMPLGPMGKMAFDLSLATRGQDVFRALFLGVTRSGLAIMISLLCYGLFFGYLKLADRSRE